MTLSKTQTRDTMKGMTEKVDPNKTYTATDIRVMDILPWARDSRLIARILESGAIKNIEVSGKNTHKRYLVQGQEIINYLNQYGQVLLPTVRKKKKYVKERSKAKRRKASKK